MAVTAVAVVDAVHGEHILRCFSSPRSAWGLPEGSFAVGIGFVSRWYEREHQGTALGMFGIGNVGAAVTNFGAPFLLVAFGWERAAQVYAVALFVTVILFFLVTREDPVTARRKAMGREAESRLPADRAAEAAAGLEILSLLLLRLRRVRRPRPVAAPLLRRRLWTRPQDRRHAGCRVCAPGQHLSGARGISVGPIRRAPRDVLDVHREHFRLRHPELSVDRLRGQGSRRSDRVQHHHLAPGVRDLHRRSRLRDVARKGGRLQAHPGLLSRPRGFGRRARRDDRRARRVRPADLLRGHERPHRGLDELLHAALRPGRDRPGVDALLHPTHGTPGGRRGPGPTARTSRASLRARGGAPRSARSPGPAAPPKS